MDIWSFLFPKKCVQCRSFGSYLCAGCFTRLDYDVPLICGVCGKRAVGGLTHPGCQGRYTIDGIFAALVFRGVCKKLVYQFKFQPNLNDLRKMMGELMYEGLIQQEVAVDILNKNDFVFIPIPLTRERLRMRGYNQAELLSRELSRFFLAPTLNALMRIKRTTSQVGKTRDERRENIKDAFALRVDQHVDVQKKIGILVDDVVTSGATMNEAARILKKAGFKKVYGVAFAHGV